MPIFAFFTAAASGYIVWNQRNIRVGAILVCLDLTNLIGYEGKEGIGIFGMATRENILR